jgi:hypothetical protein
MMSSARRRRLFWSSIQPLLRATECGQPLFVTRRRSTRPDGATAATTQVEPMTWVRDSQARAARAPAARV